MPAATVRDVSEGAEAARKMSTLVLIMGVVPILAPAIGGVVLGFASWRVIFWAAAVYGLLCIGLVWRVLPETLPHERLSPGADIVGQRLSVIRRLVHPEDGHPVNVVVAPVRAILQPLVTKLAELQPVHLKAKDEANFDDIIRRLADAGYARVDIVEKRGQFAVRGGLIDVFPPTEEHPLRIEFWGDEVDEVRYFAVADQRSLGAAEEGLYVQSRRLRPRR